MNEIKKGAGIQSLQIGLSIIDIVANHGQPLSFMDIFEKSKITKSNLYKYLHTLTATGFLYRDKYTGHYTLGSKIVEYGMASINRENILDRVTPYLQDLNNRSQETVIFSIWSNKGPMVVRIINSTKGILNVGAQLGTLLPIHTTAGKLFAAFKNKTETETWLKEEINEEKYPFIVDELEKVRRERVAISVEPLAPSINSVGVPILNYNQEILGTITIAGFSDSLPLEKEHPIIQELIRIGGELSQSYGDNTVQKELKA
jgi:DNA-binding IclR family transcriptional regulator